MWKGKEIKKGKKEDVKDEEKRKKKRESWKK